MRLRPVPIVVLSVVLAGCGAAKPGDPGVTSVDHSWLRSRDLFDRFDTAATDFSPVNAYLLALAVRAGDMNTADQRETLRTWGFGKHEPIIDRSASVYAYVASNDRMVLAVFSGTDIRNIRDLESDADALYPVRRERYARADGALVHRGFATNMDAVWEDVTDEVARQANAGDAPPRPVFVTGHSRGGAFAMLAAAGWAQDPGWAPGNVVRVAGLYTFGQPRVGNLAFAQHVNSLDLPYCRVINDRDAIAGVPLKIGNLGAEYVHGGAVAHLASGPVLRKDPAVVSLRLIVIDPDHYLDNYLRSLYAVVTVPARIEHPAWRAGALAAAPPAATAPTTANAAPPLPRPPF